MKTISMLLDQLIDVREKYRKGKVEISPKEMPLMILLKELGKLEESEDSILERIECLQREAEMYVKDLERSRDIKLNVLTAAESEIKRLGVGHVSNWVQAKIKE